MLFEIITHSIEIILYLLQAHEKWLNLLKPNTYSKR